jgi:hypothetical protein
MVMMTPRQIWQIFASEKPDTSSIVIVYLRSALQEMVLYLAFRLDYYHPLLEREIYSCPLTQSQEMIVLPIELVVSIMLMWYQN